VSFSDVVSRVAALHALAQRGLAPTAPLRPGPVAPPGRLLFEEVLAGTLAPATPVGPSPAQPVGLSAAQPIGLTGLTSLQPLGLTLGQTPGLRALAAATGELGVAEEPPGSNDAPRIADYRSAVAGSYTGAPWCAYFVSWAAREAGAPLGDGGEGFGAVEQIADWASRTGRLVPPGTPPSPGDLILFGGRHVGIVESVSPDGSLTTIEGNEDHAVRRVQRAESEATGFVRL
jgi:hypothetical protein